MECPTRRRQLRPAPPECPKTTSAGRAKREVRDLNIERLSQRALCLDICISAYLHICNISR